MTREEEIVKRWLDIAFACVGLIVLWPLMGLIAVTIKVGSSGPVLYRSVRLGRGGRVFVMYKFRSMYLGSPQKVAADGSLEVAAKDERVTAIGRLLRFGLDELPQLWNVLRGDMSIVGPRPDLPFALERYQGDERIRISVRPGITGLAQIRGRTSIPWRERLAWDVRYVNECSLGLDFRIMIETVAYMILPWRRNRTSVGQE